jgi:tetratricopeptide (TPR) repeat protein
MAASASRNGDAGHFDVRERALYSRRMDDRAALPFSQPSAKHRIAAAAVLGTMLAAMAAAPAPAGGPPVVLVQEALEEVPGEADEQALVRRDALLDSLFERLAAAPDESTARLLEEAVWQIWLRSGSDTVDVLMQQSIKAMGESEPAKALDILDAVVALAPDYAEGWNKRATVLFVLDRHDESMRDIARVLELEPRHFGALSGIGLIQRELGEKERALAAFRQALTIHPFLPGARQAIEELTKDVEGQGI